MDFAVLTRPDVVVVIDSPDFTHRRRAASTKARSLQFAPWTYVAPQVWASRTYRAKAMASYFDLVLALFPFEVPFFEKYGLKAAFVGSSGGWNVGVQVKGGRGRAHGWALPPKRHCWRCCRAAAPARYVLSLPVFRDAVTSAGERDPGLVTVLPTVPHVAAKVREATQGWATPLTFWKARPTNMPPSTPPMSRWRPSGTVHGGTGAEPHADGGGL